MTAETVTAPAWVIGRGVLPREGRDEDRAYSRVVTLESAPLRPLLDRRLQVLEWWAYESELKQRLALESVMRRMFEQH